jgi:hypothetical protein
MHQGRRPPPRGLPRRRRLGGTPTVAAHGRHGGVGFSARPGRSRSGGFEVATPGPTPATTSSSSSQTDIQPSARVGGGGGGGIGADSGIDGTSGGERWSCFPW